MKIQYDVLYKNGQEDSIVQEDLSEKEVGAMDKVIRQGLENDDVNGILTFGQGHTGYFVRLSAVDRIKVTWLDAEVPDEKR